MKSAVPHTPMMTRGTAVSGPPAAMSRGRVARAGAADAGGVPTIVIAGAPRCGKSSVANALLDAPLLAPPAAAGGGIVPGSPVTCAYVSIRHGEEPRAYAYVPGRRTPRPFSVDQLRVGDAGAVVRGGPGRPPRRVEVLHSADLLRKVNLVDTPGVGGFDRVYTDIVLDALDAGAGLLFVTEASTALLAEQLDFLAQVEQRGVPVTFVLTKIDSYPQWPAVLSANQKLVHDHAPRLATSRWYAVSTIRSCDGASPAAVEEAARGLVGLGIGALRRALTEPAPGELPAGPDGPVGPSPSGAGAPRVADGATDAQWARVLDREIRAFAAEAREWLSGALAAIRLRCAREINRSDGCARLPYVIDRELHALSVRATRTVDDSATAIMRTVFGTILVAPPDGAAVERVRRATRRAILAADGGAPEWDRALLVTSTGGVAVTAGHGAVAGFAAVGSRPAGDELLPPIGAALSANCYGGQPGNTDRGRCRDWLDHTVEALEVELGRELAERFAYLREALAVVAADTVDHGVLLT
ncbi:hypothetical protein HC031_28835 [Planosporangium thailandense]|uniref:Dynamin N-terminal domain-containing protein n=1 Tax=Planosporangium thailandense TaxID=765197 RepID=A0ABX0Y5J8_9ACTN|nr:dynamin family protein [Planosporangium thailandense]NJC73696.1 hypothetical protein [Planosporangium thailandense]